MPLYDFKCAVCDAKREALLKLDELETSVVKCFHCGNAMNRQLSAPHVVNDYQGYDCPITGKWIEGRRAHIENLARHGCRIYEPGETEAARRNRRQADEALENAVGETVEREIHLMPTDKREKLAVELERGFDTQVIRTSPNA